MLIFFIYVYIIHYNQTETDDMNASSANSKYKNIIGKAKATIIFFQHPTLQMYKRKKIIWYRLCFNDSFQKKRLQPYFKKLLAPAALIPLATDSSLMR